MAMRHIRQEIRDRRAARERGLPLAEYRRVRDRHAAWLAEVDRITYEEKRLAGLAALADDLRALGCQL